MVQILDQKRDSSGMMTLRQSPESSVFYGSLGEILETGRGASDRSSGTAARSSNSDAGSKNLQATAAANCANRSPGSQ
jgi:hypothetical protein